jgi:hypothetical protein
MLSVYAVIQALADIYTNDEGLCDENMDKISLNPAN